MPLVIETLRNNSDRTDDSFICQEVIKWLKNHEINHEEMISLEWDYLNSLIDYDFFPDSIINKMTNDPDYYIEILRLTYKNEETNDEKKNMEIKKGHYLLKTMQRIPGLREDESLDEHHFDNWMSAVIRKSKCSDIYMKAMQWIGALLFHAPEEKDGFFINYKIADFLELPENTCARYEYYVEAINSRGAHWVDPTGKTEFAIEKKFQKKVNMAEGKGYFEFAKILRRIAEFYHEQGEKNIEENRDEDSSLYE